MDLLFVWDPANPRVLFLHPLFGTWKKNTRTKDLRRKKQLHIVFSDTISCCFSSMIISTFQAIPSEVSGVRRSVPRLSRPPCLGRSAKREGPLKVLLVSVYGLDTLIQEYFVLGLSKQKTTINKYNMWDSMSYPGHV